MGRLAGYTYKTASKRLRGFGFVEYRPGKGSHQIWYNQATKLKTVIPKHPGDIPEGTMRAILRQADIKPDEFLKHK